MINRSVYFGFRCKQLSGFENSQRGQMTSSAEIWSHTLEVRRRLVEWTAGWKPGGQQNKIHPARKLLWTRKTHVSLELTYAF